jgi:YD repeat-containing protein
MPRRPPSDQSGWHRSSRFTSESDAAGDTLTLSYGAPLPGAGNCPSSATSCETITSASGRALVLGLNSSSLVTSVTDPMGRSWTYGYTGSDLTSVTDPMANVTSYGYDSGNANPLLTSDITTITKPNGQTGGPDAGAHIAIAWDGAGRATSVTDPMGFKTSYNWTGFNPSTGTGLITVTDADGNATVYDYTLGTLAAQSVWNGAAGSTLASEQDYVPDQTSTSGDNSAGTQLDVATADGDGNTTVVSYDTHGNPVTTTAPDGVGNQLAQTTEQSTSLDQPDCSQAVIANSTCTASSGPAPVAAGGVISAPSSAPPQGITWTQYDTDGNALWTTIGVYAPGSSSAAYAQTTYQLFTGNSVTLNSTNISCAGTPPSPSLPCATINADGVVTQLGYNAQGDLTSSSTPDGNSGGGAGDHHLRL